MKIRTLLLSILFCTLISIAYADNVPSLSADRIEDLISEGKYREAMHAYRSLGSIDSLQKAYQIESDYLWTESAVVFSGGHSVQGNATKKWVGSNYSIAIRTQDGQMHWFYAQEKNVSGSAKLQDYITYKLAETAAISRESPVGVYGVVMKDGTVKDIGLNPNTGVVYVSSVPYRTPWENIVYRYKFYALTKGGTLIDSYSKTKEKWPRIVDFVCTGSSPSYSDYLFGLKPDGTLLVEYTEFESTVKNLEKYDPTIEQRLKQSLERAFSPDIWYDITDIDCSDNIIIGYRKDGTVIASCKMRNWEWDTRILPEMHGVADVKAIFLSRAEEKAKMHFVGLCDDGTLVSTIPGFPYVDNVAAFDVGWAHAKYYGNEKIDGLAGLTVFCLMRDNSFMRFGVDGKIIDPYIKTNLPPVICDESVELINRLINPLKLMDLTPELHEYNLGETVTLQTSISGYGEIEAMEYCVYNSVGEHITGYSGISPFYSFVPPCEDTYTVRVYLKPCDGEWHSIDSSPILIRKAKEPIQLKSISTVKDSVVVGECANFVIDYLGNDEDSISQMLFYIYDENGLQQGEPWVYNGFIGHYNTELSKLGNFVVRVYMLTNNNEEQIITSAPFVVSNK